MPSEPVLVVAAVSKVFRIYERPHHRLIEWLSGGRAIRHQCHAALREVDFMVRPGEVLGIMGRNGAGKTSLLAVLAGLLPPTSGTIRCVGTVSALINLGAGFDPEASGVDNVRCIISLLEGIKAGESEIAEVAAFAELGEAMARPYRTYSAGMQLRLAFACATRRRPDVLLVDEVLAVGDLFFRQKCHARIREMVSQGTAVVLVSHDYTEIGQSCDRAMVLEQGRIAFLGGSREAVAYYLQTRSGPPGAGCVIESRPASTSVLSWPDSVGGLDLDRTEVVGCDRARIVRVAVIDSDDRQQQVFVFGQTMRVLVEIQAVEPLAVPVIGWTLTDEHGLLITGGSTHFLPVEEWPEALGAGQRWRVRFDIDLLLRFGEYVLGFGLGDMSASSYSSRQGRLPEEVGGYLRRIGSVMRVAVIAVVPDRDRIPGVLAHHGLVSLPCRLVHGAAMDGDVCLPPVFPSVS